MGAATQAAVWDRLLRLPVSFFRDYSAGDLATRSLGIDAVRQALTGSTLDGILSGVVLDHQRRPAVVLRRGAAARRLRVGRDQHRGQRHRRCRPTASSAPSRRRQRRALRHRPAMDQRDRQVARLGHRERRVHRLGEGLRRAEAGGDGGPSGDQLDGSVQRHLPADQHDRDLRPPAPGDAASGRGGVDDRRIRRLPGGLRPVPRRHARTEQRLPQRALRDPAVRAGEADPGGGSGGRGAPDRSRRAHRSAGDQTRQLPLPARAPARVARRLGQHPRRSSSRSSARRVVANRPSSACCSGSPARRRASSTSTTGIWPRSTCKPCAARSARFSRTGGCSAGPSSRTSSALRR